MHLIYIDDSKDSLGAGPVVFSGLAIPVEQWRDTFQRIKAYRQELKRRYGIALKYELHATDFVKGKGSLGAPRFVPKGLRCAIFKNTIKFIAEDLPGVRAFHVSFPISREDWAFERLLNRINRTMQTWNSHALLMCDEGKEGYYTGMVRRMGVYNPIQSAYGAWEDGAATKNITIDRIIEDPVFKVSRNSYFIQMVDFCAYALLRQDRPTPYALKYGLDQAFQPMPQIGIKETAITDPQYVIRYK